MKKIKFKSKLFICLTTLISLTLIGSVWQSIMVGEEDEKYPPVGDYIDVGTYNAHFYTKGDGDTSFVFISGAGTPSAYTDFYYLQNQLAKYGQTITFDHAGLGWSEATASNRTIDNLVKELSIIVDTVSKDRKIILIAHSLGSMEAIGYAQTNPDKVKGIIFLDGGSPEFYRTDSQLSPKIMNRTLAATRACGVTRLLGACHLPLPVYGENMRYKQLPNELQAVDKIMYYRHSGSDSNFKNIDYINENADTILSGDRLGYLPILVLSSDNGAAWSKVQMQLSAWSHLHQQITVKNASHYIHWSNYNEIIEYIEKFIHP